MKKNKFKIEYQLKSASINVLWNSIGTAFGLAEWFADVVTVNENEFTFSWEENDQTAILLHSKPNTYIRFQWDEDKNTDYYFELKIDILEVTGDLTLVITDFAEPNDTEDLILLWNQQIEVLRRKMGV